MRGKLSLLIGLGAGYVLGTKAGRERYDQMAGKAKQVWRDPRVQDKAGKVQHVAQAKAGQAGHAVQEKVSEKASQAGQAVKEKISSSHDQGTGSTAASSTFTPPSGATPGPTATGPVPTPPPTPAAGGTSEQARPTGPGLGTNS